MHFPPFCGTDEDHKVIRNVLLEKNIQDTMEPRVLIPLSDQSIEKKTQRAWMKKAHRKTILVRCAWLFSCFKPYPEV
jgi:hypothetical protein